MAMSTWGLLALAGSLAAQGAPKAEAPAQAWELKAPSSEAGAPLATVALGSYSQSVSHGYGLWRGLLLDTTWDPKRDGKFIASLISFQRDMGSGTVVSLGKYQEFKGGYGFLGVATSTGADYLPTLQVVTDLNLQVPPIPGLVLGGAFVYTRVRDHHENLLWSLGPTLYAGDFISTVRLSRNRSLPGNQDSSSTMISVRHGAQDFRPWQSLRVSWGGEAYQSLVVHEPVQARGAGAGLDCFFPVGSGWTLQTGVEWGQKLGAYHLWGGSLRVGRMFR